MRETLLRLSRLGSSTAALSAGGFVLAAATAFTAIRMGVAQYSPVGMVLLRLLVASLAMTVLVALRFRRSGGLTISAADGVRLVGMGLSGAVAYNLLLTCGQRTVSAFGASLLVNTVPIWTALLATLHLDERLGGRAWLGVAIGFMGATLVGSFEGGLELGLAGAAAILAAAICQAVYFVLLRSVVGRIGAERAALFTLWIATLVLLPFGHTMVRDVMTAEAGATAAVIYLGAVPGTLGVWAWATAMRHVPASRLAPTLYLVPPLAAVVAWLTLGEVPAIDVAAGGGLSLLGVALVTIPGATRPTTAVEATGRRRCCDTP